MKSTESFRDIKSIQISISSPEDILKRSHGEVINTRSINYKTMHAERGGLFCESIFGPMKEYECRCGALEGTDYLGKKCSICGVEVNTSRLRRYRMGHINLASHVPHVWFLKIRPFYLLSIMGIRMKDLENLLLSRSEIVSIIRPRSVRERLSGAHRYKVLQGKKIYKGSGCEVVYNYLASIDLTYEYLYQRSSIINLINSNIPTKSTTENHRAEAHYNYTRSHFFLSYLKRLRILECFLRSKKRPEWMMLSVVPVLPPELRPFLLMDNNLVVSSDLNFLYKRIVERNSRLRTLYKLKERESQYSISSFYYNELCMLQHAVDSLIENGRRGKAIISRKQIALRSLTHVLKGKEGRFRMNLLGKRVDLSARTVISVGPRLKMTQCGIPLSIALVLFKSLIYDKISSISSIPKTLLSKIFNMSRTHLSSVEPSFLDYLYSSQMMYEIENIAQSNPVLLNRAPTLHKLNIQAFQPVVINSKALQLHPLVCSSFNADFDGDQMAIHLPLSLSSQIESRILMMTYNNIINPSNGSAIIAPTQDIVFGIYYATEIMSSPEVKYIFYNIEDIRSAYYSKYVSLHTPIFFYLKDNNQLEKHVTTPGRIFLYKMIPHGCINFIKINKTFTKKSIQDLIKIVHEYSNYEDFLYFLDNLMAFGFYYAHISGVSLSLEDIAVPSLKNLLVHKASKTYDSFARYKKTQDYSTNMHSIEVSSEKLKQQMVSHWFQAQEDLTSLILMDVYGSKKPKSTPPIYMLIHSGARGSILQMRQLSGIRGLMVKPSGDLIEMPIKANFKEGLNVLEYFYSTHGARKGVIDTSIRTATSGYLTRRLVHAVQDMVVCEEDCGSKRFILLYPEFSSGKEQRSISSMSYSRVSQSKTKDLLTSEIIIGENQLINSFNSEMVQKLEELRVRSPLTCESKDGICKACYGGHLANNTLVSIGEAVGILSAQSIGEPGTQLTMRTFHMGGVLLGGQSSSKVFSIHNGRVYLKRFHFFPMVISSSTNYVAMSVNQRAEICILSDDSKIVSRYILPLGSMVYVKDGDFVEKGRILFQWNPYYEPIVYKGLLPSYIRYEAFEMRDRKILKMWLDNGSTKGLRASSRIEIDRDFSVEMDHLYYYHHRDILIRRSGEKVFTGDILFLYPRSQQSSSDITGGLSRISQLFEASYPNKGRSLIESNGWYFVRPLVSNSDIKWKVIPFSNKKNRSSLFSNHHLRIRSITFFYKGDNFSFVPNSLYEILSILGSYDAIEYLKKEILSIYMANGVTIHDKHIELILKRMFGRIEILDCGSSPYVMSETVDSQEFIYQNILSLSKGLTLAKGCVSARGITSISLDSKSFLSASSFQNTAQVLTSSAILSRRDKLTGLGENVILGRLSPIGSASFSR